MSYAELIASPVRRIASTAISQVTRVPWLLLLTIALVVRVLTAIEFPLLYPESRYVEYSRFLSLGYAEDPPMIAWLIRTFSLDHAIRSCFGIRISSLLLGLASYVVFSIWCWRLFRNEAVLRSASLVFLSLPVIAVVGVLAVPESALLCFSLAFLLSVWQAMEQQRSAHWLLAGTFLGLALLSRMAALGMLAGVALFMAGSPAHRHWLRRKEPYLGLALALLVFSPFICWNMANGCIGFSHQLWHHYTPRLDVSLGSVGEFLVEQLANAGVLLLVPVVASLLVSPRGLPEEWRAPFLFVRLQGLTVLAFFAVACVVLETHPQTTLMAYPCGAICAAAYWSPKHRRAHLRKVHLAAWITLGSLLAGAVLIAPGLAVLKGLNPQTLGEKLGPKVLLARERLFGWERIEGRLSQELGRVFPENEGRLFTHLPQLSTMVSYHHGGGPVIDLVPFVLKGYSPGVSQEYYISPQELAGQSGIYFGEEDGPPPPRLRTVFEHVEELAPIEISHKGQLIKRYRVCVVRRLKPTALNSK